jgi:hypothetical protein
VTGPERELRLPPGYRLDPERRTKTSMRITCCPVANRTFYVFAVRDYTTHGWVTAPKCLGAWVEQRSPTIDADRILLQVLVGLDGTQTVNELA